MSSDTLNTTGAFSQAKDLKNRILFTIFILIIYRLGTYVPLAGIDPLALKEIMASSQKGLLGMFNMFSGGAVTRMAIFALGIMPYISSSIIVQLLTGVSDYFKNLKEQGEIELFLKVEARLKAFIAPSSSNRVQLLGEGYYLEAYKSWRILFLKEESHIDILAIFSGYDVETLKGFKTSIWEDLPLHRRFVRNFYSFFSETFVGKGWILYSAFKRKKEGPLWEVFLNEAL